MLWRTSVVKNFRGEMPVEEFFKTYLPGTETGDCDTIDGIVKKAASKLATAAVEARTASLENDYAPALIEYLTAAVSNFPKDTKPEFCDTSSVHFPPIDPEDHRTSPDITATRPGRKIPSKPRGWRWSDAGTVLELKLKTDIFRPDGEIDVSDKALDALVQIAKSARSLLASGFRFVFVVAVIKTKARVFRFDRAGHRSTEAFDWTKPNGNVIPRLFWRLYNPKRADDQLARIYGEDETITIPTPDDKERMYQAWLTTSSYKAGNHLSLKDATEHSRWAKARKGDEDVNCFTVGPPLSQSDGLFSRATRVDRVMIDGDSTPTVYALKDAWRQLCRRPEKDYYDVIGMYCSELDPPPAGMAQCLGSVEIDGHNTILGDDPQRQRCHTRSLLTPVGIPLKHFPSSKKLVLALAAAVRHHKIALEAGVMQRDVSEGNVLFDELTMEGFLVDYDYAEFTEQGEANFEDWFSARANSANYATIDKSMKDLTGTYPFLAIELLEKTDTAHTLSHDLESFYWLLTWVILRYTAHTHPAQTLACHELFDVMQRQAAPMKRGWVSKSTPLDPKSRLALLANGMRHLVYRQNPTKSEDDDPFEVVDLGQVPPVYITYSTVETVFTKVMNHHSWDNYPDSAALVFTVPCKKAEQAKADTVSLHQSLLESRARAALDGPDALADGSGIKRKREPATPSNTTPTPDLSAGESSESAAKKPRTIKSMMRPRER
ncbi:hypothetical protein C8R47DRAFT_1002656 [Mycena vitilis]|nr:hypothetical protein C8R47DRAFT_1002656 [Mycena vitilis]